MKSAIKLSVLFVALVSFSGHASANEFTDVIDAFDYEYNDPFDINFSVGYLMQHRSGTITRESTLKRAHEWDFYGYQEMFAFKHVQHILDMNVEVGIFRDVSLRVGFPLILSDTRSVTANSDLSWGRDADTWRATPDHTTEALFGAFGQDKVFDSPKRSGVDYFSVGLWGNPLDQSREISFPTWTLFVEGRFGVGAPLRAACAQGEVGCYSDDFVDRGGVGRGVHELRFGTRLSRRFGIVDPYFGVDAMVGFPVGDTDDTDFYVSKQKSGQINTLPPVRGTMDFGTEIVPWEQRHKDRKLVIGLGGGATFVSEGRDYTPLYDVLGTSEYFHTQEFVDFNGDGVRSNSDERAATDRWTGMTDIENYAVIFGQAFVLMQPAKYIKFRFGGKWAYETGHFITKTDMCAIDLMSTVTGGGGACENYNLGHRPEIDRPGSRFRAEKTFAGSLFADLTAMF